MNYSLSDCSCIRCFFHKEKGAYRTDFIPHSSYFSSMSAFLLARASKSCWSPRRFLEKNVYVISLGQLATRFGIASSLSYQLLHSLFSFLLSSAHFSPQKNRPEDEVAVVDDSLWELGGISLGNSVKPMIDGVEVNSYFLFFHREFSCFRHGKRCGNQYAARKDMSG